MDAILAVLIPLSAFALVNVLDFVIERKFPCTCGRSRDWYYSPKHARGGHMLARALWVSVFALLNLALVHWFAGPFMCLLAAYSWRCWWFHEKGKIQRKAAKALGRVVHKGHRLVVVNDG